MMHIVRGFQLGVVLAVILPFEAVGQALRGGPAAHAAGFRELAVSGTRQFPGLLHSMVYASEGDREAVEALADTMVAVALHFAADLTADGKPVATSRKMVHTIIDALHAAGSWPATASRGSRFNGAGERLIRIAVEMPVTTFDPLNRCYPLLVLADLPDTDHWKKVLVDLARGPYPMSAAAVMALWPKFDGAGRELVMNMYRRGELVDARTKGWVEFLNGAIHEPLD